MTKILINAINLSSAGGLTVALNFLKSINHVANIQFDLVAPKNCGYEAFNKSQNINCYLFAPLTANPIRRLLFDYYTLKVMVKKLDPDVIFTMGNFALPVKNRKQLLLFMWPYAIYPEALEIQKRSLQSRFIQYLRLFFFKRRLKYATIVAPQTKVAERRLLKLFPGIGTTVVVPTAYSNLEQHTASITIKVPDNKINLLCLTRYYVHKNVEILVQVARLMKKSNANYRIVLTMSVDEHPNVLKINNQIEQEELQDYIMNIGSVPITSVRKVYSFCEALVLPTKLESFSATYVDAMFLEKTHIYLQFRFRNRSVRGYSLLFQPGFRNGHNVYHYKWF